MNNAFGMIPKVQISVFPALNSKCRAESRQFIVASTESGGEHCVYSTSTSSFPSFQKHCNHLKTASRKLKGVTSWELGTTLLCKHTKCNRVLFSHTTGGDGFSGLLAAMMGRALWWVQEEVCNTDTFNIRQVSASAAGIISHTCWKASLMISGGNYTLIPRWH